MAAWSWREMGICYHNVRQKDDEFFHKFLEKGRLIFPNPEQPEIPSSASSTSVQVQLTITATRQVLQHDCDSDTYTYPDRSETPDIARETERFDLDLLLKNRRRASNFLARMLARLVFVPTSEFDRVIDEIISEAVRMAMNLDRNKPGRNFAVLHLDSEIGIQCIEHVNAEAYLIRRALEVSALQFERRNHGMVPANKSSVKKMLKRVRVVQGAGEGEEEEGQQGISFKKRRVSGETNCVICLEEVKVGCYATMMPCSHSFHGKCIQQWLSRSHYCPICRFEMPVN